MKKIKLLPLILVSIATFCGVFAVKSVSGSFDDEIVMVSANNSAEADYFINVVWTNFRETHQDICNVSYEDYYALMNEYKALSDEDLVVVNATKDPLQPEYTIGQVVAELVRTHYQIQSSNQNIQQKLDQSTTITIAVVVSIFGMSAISVLYILKNKKYID